MARDQPEAPVPGRPPALPRTPRTIARVLSSLSMAGLLAGAGLAMLYQEGTRHDQGIAVLAFSVLAGAIALVFGMMRSAPLPERPAGALSTLRSLSLFLQLLTFVGALIVVGAIVIRLGIAQLPTTIVVRAEPFIIFLLGAMQAATHLAVINQPGEQARSGPLRILGLVGVLATVVLVVVGIQGAYGDETVRKATGIEPAGAPILLVAAAVLASVSLRAAQPIPTFLSLLGSTGIGSLPGSRARGVVLPIVVAFSLLVLSLLMFVLFGVGVFGIIDQVAASPWILIVFIAILVGVVGAVTAALRLVKEEETKAPLYRPITDPRAKLERETLLTGSIVATLLLGLAAATFLGLLPVAKSLWIHFAAFGVLIALGPYGFLIAKEASRVRRLEERFPDFLREIASSHKGGLTLAESVSVAARADYGPLSEEVKRMADQIAWNVPFTEALERFSDRVRTPLVQRAVNLILEANRSGGSSTDILLAAARDAREIKTLENERRISMSLYTMIIYITFFVFLGVAAVLYAQFVPQLVESSKAAAGVRAQGGAIGSAGAGSVNLGAETLSAADFQLFYFLAALVQALGDGIVAGLMGTGRAVLGLRHSFLMVAITYVTFAVFLR